MKKYKIILFLFVLSTGFLSAQDIHYSQFNASPQNLNPAQTGLFDGDWRFVGNFRSQWSVIPVPYRTFSFAADTRLKTKLEKDVPAAGLIVNTDKSGDSKFTTTQILVSGAYIKKLNKDSTHFVSLGIQPGITTKSFNLSALTFDNQYDGDAYNASLSSGENFPKTRMTYFDLGGGIAYLWRKNHRTLVNVGVSVLHLNRPKQSFFNNDDIRLDMKTCVSGIAEFPVAAQLDVLPSIMYQRQGKFQETVVGLFGKYHLKPINGMTTAVSLGGFYRMKDAFILVANMDYKNFNVGVSYDINTSKLIEATNRRGGFEISVIYIFKKVTPFIAKKRVCPIYM
ncbi:MAG: PorP/SprF family type IX secretion system membrane protein [Bacteroidetes bacterium]|nr:PorP/SprF family type IX secretion system membrane protein [Bacteroidota bacterium]